MPPLEAAIEDPRQHVAAPDKQHDAVSPGSDPCDAPPPQTMPLVRFWIFSIGISLGLFLAMMDTSIVATSLYAIAADLDSNEADDASWVALAYTLAFMGFAVVFARASDVLGRRTALVAAHALFAASSLACGWASTLRQLVAFRALQGVAGSGLYSLAMVVLPEASPPAARRHIGGIIGLVVAAAGVLGPLLGGALADRASWRWIFWMNAPVGAAALAILPLSWPPRRPGPARGAAHSWKRLDYPGAVLTVAAAVLVVFAFQAAGSATGEEKRDGWSSALFIAPLATGLLCWAALFAWQHTVERRLAARLAPIFPTRLLRRHPLYASGLLNTLLLGFPHLLLLYVVPLRIQVLGRRSALVAGLMLLPMLVAVAVGSFLAGAMSAKNGNADNSDPRETEPAPASGRPREKQETRRPDGRADATVEILLAGSALMLLGCGLLATLSRSPHELDTPKLLGFITFCGLGFGLTVSSSTMIAAREVPTEDFASAQGILSQLRILGGTLGIAASTAILGRENANAVSAPAPARGPVLAAAQAAYARAFHADMLVASVVSALALACALAALVLRQRSRSRAVPDQDQQQQAERGPGSESKPRPETGSGGKHPRLVAVAAAAVAVAVAVVGGRWRWRWSVVGGRWSVVGGRSSKTIDPS